MPRRQRPASGALELVLVLFFMGAYLATVAAGIAAVILAPFALVRWLVGA